MVGGHSFFLVFVMDIKYIMQNEKKYIANLGIQFYAFPYPFWLRRS